MVDRIAPRIETPTSPQHASPRVVWRSWLLAPERRPLREDTLVLTGLFGFPWRTGNLEAKCTVRDHDRVVGLAPRMLDRHHASIPAVDCTCGIYASYDLSATPAANLIPTERPVVTGFVELSGRSVTTGAIMRASRARIVGPLTILPGTPPWTSRVWARFGRIPEPATVTVERTMLRVTWGSATVGMPWASWRARAVHQLTRRYGVEVR